MASKPKWNGDVPVAATAVVKSIEGFSAKPYDDNGAQPGGTWTIGYGAIRDKANKPVTPSTPPISEADAEELLLRDMRGAADSVKKRVTVDLTAYEAAALISWTFNLGEGSLASSTMLKKINSGQKGSVPDEMRKWINQEESHSPAFCVGDGPRPLSFWEWTPQMPACVPGRKSMA